MEGVSAEFKAACEETDVSAAAAAIKTLISVLSRSEAQTIMGLGDELKQAADAIVKCGRESAGSHFFLPVQAACEMFLKYITRSSSSLLVQGDFADAKTLLVQRGKTFGERLVRSRERLAVFGAKFVGYGQTVMCHGYSRAIVSVLKKALERDRNFDVIVLESKPEGMKLASKIADLRIPVTVIPDHAVGFMMERVDLVLVGAESITENGGVANRIGTYPLAIIAKAHKKPFYVASESFKFSRYFPLSQRELREIDPRPDDLKRNLSLLHSDTLQNAEKWNITLESPETDYTPPEFITLMFTDLGVLTPSAVSDELIKLYQ